MPSLIYGASSFDRETGALPPFTLINMFVEKAATSENQACLQSRPGLSQIASNGTGPINAIFAERGVFSGDYFTISDLTLYRNTTSKGTITGTGPISIAGCTSEILIAAGGALYSYNGTNLQATFSGIGNDSDNVIAVTFIGSLFVAAEANSAHFYWSTALNGRSWDALDFATAEREPDELLDIAALNDKLILYGQSTIEVHAHTGDADLPFTRIEGIGSQSKGILSTGCKCEADNTLFHVGSDGAVYRFGEQFDRISEPWLDEKIIASASVKMLTFRIAGHEFVCVRLDSQTFAYDCSTGTWSELQTNGGNFTGQCAAMVGTDVYFGNDSDGTVMGFSGYDDLGDALTREFTAGVPLDQPASINNLWLWVDSGASTVLSGQGSDPRVEQQSSRDAGRTWTDFDDASLGNASLGGTGQYRVIPEWRRLGQFDAPGLLFRFRVTDPVPFRVSAVKVNEPLGGRSRG